MKWLIVGVVLGVLGVRIFDAITEHEPVVRPPPLELSEGGVVTPARDAASVRKLPMRIRVDAIDPSSKTLLTKRKDGVRIRSVITGRTEIRNGFAEASFGDIKVGDMVNGSRVKRADDAYEVLTITKIEPPREALDKQTASNLPAASTQEPEESIEHDDPRP